MRCLMPQSDQFLTLNSLYKYITCHSFFSCFGIIFFYKNKTPIQKFYFQKYGNTPVSNCGFAPLQDSCVTCCGPILTKRRKDGERTIEEFPSLLASTLSPSF